MGNYRKLFPNNNKKYAKMLLYSKQNFDQYYGFKKKTGSSKGSMPPLVRTSSLENSAEV